MKIAAPLFAALWLFSFGEARAASAPYTPWKEPSRRLRFEEVVATLHYWAEKHPGVMKIEQRGQTSSGLPLMLARFTDPSVPDEAKQVLLVTAFHAGAERSGATSAMHFIEWLLSDEPLARETLAKQIVLVMPVMNPRGFVAEANANESLADPYSAGRGSLFDIPTLALKAPAALPEVAAFMAVVDEVRPELHVDLHGVSIGWKGMETPETAGPAGSNTALRPWDSRFDERLIHAANEAGYGIYRMEMDEERLHFAPQMAPHANALWWGRPFFYTGMYPYLKYHTLPVTLEITWEESAMARLKEIARIGNGTWPSENRPGYPVNVMANNGLNQLVAWGATPAEIRKSRAELWARQAHIPLGSLAPKADGRIVFLGILTAGGAAQVAKAQEPQAASATPAPVPERLSKEELLRMVESAPGFTEPERTKAFIQSGPEGRLVLNWTGLLAKPPLAEPIRNGLAFRTRIPHRNVAFGEVRLNGQKLEEGKPLGYEHWQVDGFTHLKINIPPQESSKMDLALIECSFTPAAPRSQGWAPPPEVLERIKTKTP